MFKPIDTIAFAKLFAQKNNISLTDALLAMTLTQTLDGSDTTYWVDRLVEEFYLELEGDSDQRFLELTEEYCTRVGYIDIERFRIRCKNSKHYVDPLKGDPIMEKALVLLQERVQNGERVNVAAVLVCQQLDMNVLGYHKLLRLYREKNELYGIFTK